LEACHRLALKEGQKEKGEIMNKLKLAFIVLCVATIIWGIAFYYTIQQYHKYLEWVHEQPWSEWGLAHPFWAWNGGIYIVVSGYFLILAWGVFIWKLLSHSFKGGKRTKKKE